MWISVEDRLPESYKLVLITDKITWAIAFIHCEGDWWIDSEVSDMQTIKPTHWMPLPELPK